MLTQLLSLAKAAYDMRYFLCLALSAGVRSQTSLSIVFSPRSSIWTVQKKWLWWIDVDPPDWLFLIEWSNEVKASFINFYQSTMGRKQLAPLVCVLSNVQTDHPNFFIETQVYHVKNKSKFKLGLKWTFNFKLRLFKVINSLYCFLLLIRYKSSNNCINNFKMAVYNWFVAT